MPNFKPKDIIAILMIAALVIFKLTGRDGSLDLAIAVMVGYYFAHRNDGINHGV